MPARPPSPSWTELYRLELGIDPRDKQALLDAVRKDMMAAYRGDKAAKRRVVAYERAQRAFDREMAAEERQAEKWARDEGEVVPVDPWAAEGDGEEEEDEEP